MKWNSTMSKVHRITCMDNTEQVQEVPVKRSLILQEQERQQITLIKIMPYWIRLDLSCLTPSKITTLACWTMMMI